MWRSDKLLLAGGFRNESVASCGEVDAQKNNLETQNNKARILKEKRPKNAHSADIKNVKREIRQDTEKDTQSLKQFNTARTIVGCVLLFTFGPHGNLLIHLNLHSSHK